MAQANKAIRDAIDTAGLAYWEVAGQVGIHATTLTVWLRTPLTKEQSARVNEALEQLERGKHEQTT